MFRAKDAEGIRRIQDAFNCCGFNSARDMAYPFPDASHGSDACLVRYERQRACMEPWRHEEQKVAIMLLVVPLAVFVWKIVIVLSPSSSSAWLPSAIRLPDEEGSSRRRPAIEYRDSEALEDGSSVRAAVNALNEDSSLASRVEGGRVRPSQLRSEGNVWDREDDEV